MDIATYWKTIKKEAKALTGVKKVGDGLGNKSGISSALEAYLKAVGKGDAEKIRAAATQALEKVQTYVNSIHDKELAEGKKSKSFSDAQLKSMKIVGDACDKIIEQLKAVVQGKAAAGSFDKDAKSDARDSSSRYVEPKLKKAAEQHLDLRRTMAKDSAKLLSGYASQTSQVPSFLKLAKKAATDARATKKAGDTFNNLTAIDTATRARDEIKAVLEKIRSHYDRNVRPGNSPYMAARLDFGDRDKLPDWWQADYKKESGAEFRKLAKNLDDVNELIENLKAALAEAESALDVAESFSMQAIDPGKLIAKANAVKPAAEKLFKDIELADMRVVDSGEKATEIAKGGLDPAAKAKALDTRIEDFKKRVQQVKAGEKQAETLSSRLDAIEAGVEDRGVLDAVAAAREPLARIATLLRGFDGRVKTATDAIRDARRTITDGVG